MNGVNTATLPGFPPSANFNSRNRSKCFTIEIFRIEKKDIGEEKERLTGHVYAVLFDDLAVLNFLRS